MNRIELRYDVIHLENLKFCSVNKNHFVDFEKRFSKNLFWKIFIYRLFKIYNIKLDLIKSIILENLFQYSKIISIEPPREDIHLTPKRELQALGRQGFENWIISKFKMYTLIHLNMNN